MSNYLVHRCRLFEYSPCAIHCIASMRNSTDIATSRSDGSIEIWSTSHCLLQKLVIPGSSERSIESLLWLGNRLLSGGLNGDISEYDLSNATEKLSVDSYGGAVWCLCSSPNENKIAAGCEDGSIKIFDTANKNIKYEKSFDKQEGRILSMSWHASGDAIVTGSVDVIRVWSTKSGHAIQRISLERLMKKVETIVWSVLVLNDYTIVSGDSYGRVQFWNGKNATLLKSHHFHGADVLCLCSNRESIYASGVDPKILEFNLISSEDPTSWKAGRTMQKHTHDVRALAIVGDFLVSGGVDTSLMMRSIYQKKEKFLKSSCFPAKNFVSLSKSSKLLLFQYSDYLDLWKLAKTSPLTADFGMETDKSLPIEEGPLKLLQIKTPHSETNHISCSALSSCGRWVAYSTSLNTRLYRLTKEEGEIGLKINRVRCIGLTASYKIIFTADSNYLISSATNHKLLVVKLDVDSGEARLVQMIPLQNCTTVCHLLAASSNSLYLACADIEGGINVYDISNMTHCCSLPKYRQIPTAISFHPITNTLLIAYDDLQLLECDISSNTYTEWTKNTLSTNKKPLLVMLRESTLRNKSASASPILNINHISAGAKDSLHMVSRDGIYVIERATESLKKSKIVKHPRLRARFNCKFTPLLHGEFLDDNTILVVERPMQDVIDQLPPTLYQKKFGT